MSQKRTKKKTYKIIKKDTEQDIFLKNKINPYDEYIKTINSKDGIGFIPLPDIGSYQFNEEITNKKEFNLFKIPPMLKNVKDLYPEKPLKELIDIESKRLCNEFRLSETQRFLKNFLHPETPYKSILLFHGTGVGKTCSSLSIAEGFLDENPDTNVYILLNPSIQASFRKNIFDSAKLKNNMIESQCTRDKYLQRITYSKNDSYEKIIKKIEKQINTNYHFLGYRQFGNKIRSLKNEVEKKRADLSKVDKNNLINEKIRREFSNSVFIIDEAHNIKEGGSSEEKELTTYLERVIEQSDNMKLILLSATPMFNSHTEILYLLNLLLLNEKRPLIDEKDVFKENRQQYLQYKAQGLVSYLRGEHPLRFPMKLEPAEKMLLKKFPENTFDDTPINSEEQIENFPIVGCVMKETQNNVYTELTSIDGFGTFDGDGIAASNIVFPLTASEEERNIIINNPKSKIGNLGFDTCFKKKIVKSQLKLEPQEGINMDFLDISNIGNYSTKIETILNTIEKSKGIVFIYSQFIWAGIVPLACALEMNGYTRTNGNLLDPKVIRKKKEDSNYMIISGDITLTPKNLYENYIKNIESENSEGKKVKVILGSGAAAEGLDFKMIREVHILEPWHHLSRLDQVVGRAIRNCSHLNLEIKERNVIVYYYASTLEKSNIETVDLKRYREAIKKDKKISEVIYSLKKTAVDCNFNLHGNIYNDNDLNEEIEITDAQDKKRSVKLGDFGKDGTRECQYKECEFDCNFKKIKDDKSTYSVLKHQQDKIYDIKKIIEKLFDYHTSIEIEYLVKHEPFIRDLNLNDKDKSLIYLAIRELLNDKKTYTSNKLFKQIGQKKNFLESNIVYKNGLLILEPISFKNGHKTLYELQKQSYYETKKLKLFNIEKSLEKKTKKKKTSKENELEELILEEEDQIYQYYLTITKEQIILFCEFLFKKSDDFLDENNKYNNLKKVLKRMNIMYEKPELSGYVYLEDNNTLRFVKLNKSDKPENNTFTLTEKNSEEENEYKRTWYETHIDYENPAYGKIVGYIMLKKNTPVFKISDRRIGDTKGRKSAIRRGQICDSYGIKPAVIEEYVKIFDSSYSGKKIPAPKARPYKSKHEICKDLITKFIHAEENKRDTKRWFLSLIDSYMYSIYNK